MGFVRGLGNWFSELSLRFIPDPYVIAIILTFVTFFGALGSGSGFIEALDAWYDGVWTLLPFMATLSVTLMTGDAIAKSPPFTRFLERIAAVPGSAFGAVVFTALVSILASLISWALGLIVGATLATRVGYEMKKKGIRVHYPLLVAAGYMALMTYAHGLTSSAALIMTDPTLIPKTFPEYVRGGIPIAETLGNPANLISGILVLVIIPFLLAAMHPKNDIVEIPTPIRKEIATIENEPFLEGPMVEQPVPEPAVKEEYTFADWLNNSIFLGVIVALFPAYYVLKTWVLKPGGLSNLTLNSINALFLCVAILLWLRPIRIVDQMKDSVNTISGIIFQFPFYAGIAGLLTGTGLARDITSMLAGWATPLTWPFIGLISCGIVNVFIPSGGGQWVAQGPILLETTRQLGMEPSTAVLLEMLGDQLTNMIQPFWAIPLLAIANLRARDILGYTSVAMLAAFLIVGGTLTVVLGM